MFAPAGWLICFPALAHGFDLTKASDGSRTITSSDLFMIETASSTRSWAAPTCSAQLFGEFPQNAATLGLDSGAVSIEADGVID
jgi:hypothetical protein